MPTWLAGINWIIWRCYPRRTHSILSTTISPSLRSSQPSGSWG